MPANLLTRAVLAIGMGIVAAVGSSFSAFADSGDHDVSGDEAFVAAATQGGLAEIELSTIAVRMAEAPEVRSFAMKMVQTHTESNSELAKIATRASIALPVAPDSDHMQLRDKLVALHGAEFDNVYVDAMRIDHQKMLDFLTGASTTVSSDDLRNYINQKLPMVQSHLRLAQALETH